MVRVKDAPTGLPQPVVGSRQTESVPGVTSVPSGFRGCCVRLLTTQVGSTSEVGPGPIRRKERHSTRVGQVLSGVPLLGPNNDNNNDNKKTNREKWDGPTGEDGVFRLRERRVPPPGRGGSSSIKS